MVTQHCFVHDLPGPRLAALKSRCARFLLSVPQNKIISTESCFYPHWLASPWMSFTMSFMNRMKRVGESTPPWGTPWWSKNFRPCCPSTSTNTRALLFCIYDLVHLYILPRIPDLRSFTATPSFQTLSNAFWRSIKVARTTFCLWNVSSITWARWVEWFGHL